MGLHHYYDEKGIFLANYMTHHYYHFVLPIKSAVKVTWEFFTDWHWQILHNKQPTRHYFGDRGGTINLTFT